MAPLVLFALLLSAFAPAAAQTSLSADSLTSSLQTPLIPMYKFRNGWRFSEGHDPAWADPDPIIIKASRNTQDRF